MNEQHLPTMVPSAGAEWGILEEFYNAHIRGQRCRLAQLFSDGLMSWVHDRLSSHPDNPDLDLFKGYMDYCASNSKLANTMLDLRQQVARQAERIDEQEGDLETKAKVIKGQEEALQRQMDQVERKEKVLRGMEALQLQTEKSAQETEKALAEALSRENIMRRHAEGLEQIIAKVEALAKEAWFQRAKIDSQTLRNVLMLEEGNRQGKEI